MLQMVTGKVRHMPSDVTLLIALHSALDVALDVALYIAPHIAPRMALGMALYIALHIVLHLALYIAMCFALCIVTMEIDSFMLEMVTGKMWRMLHDVTPLHARIRKHERVQV